MNSLYVYLIQKTIKSDYFKAWVLAQVRHVITVAGTAAIAKGFADQSILEGFLGLATTTVSFYLAAVDVKQVDGKITVALNTAPPEYTPPNTDKVIVRELPPIK